MRTKPVTRQRAKRLRREMTRAETIMWTRLRRRQLGGLHIRRQMPIGPYIADFACAEARLVIELDGETHSSPEELAHDERRRVYIEAEGWTIIRFWNFEVYENEEGVLYAIEEHARAGLMRAR